MTISVDIRKRMGDFLLDAGFEAGNEVLALLGSSGCGKSLTLKCVAGVLKPDEGRIVLDGRVLFDSREGINLSPQERGSAFCSRTMPSFPNYDRGGEHPLGAEKRAAGSPPGKAFHAAGKVLPSGAGIPLSFPALGGASSSGLPWHAFWQAILPL
jgi:ABC-type molybdate transport system, ATPase component